MIPPFNASMVLPPFTGDNPSAGASMSPYRTDMLSFIRRFATSAPRAALLNGLLRYRSALKAAGVQDGFQWLDGSFVEDIEAVRARPPADIDLVTFARAPEVGTLSTDIEFNAWVAKYAGLFDPGFVKQNYGCDAFFIDISKRPELLVDDTRYWFGLFRISVPHHCGRE